MSRLGVLFAILTVAVARPNNIYNNTKSLCEFKHCRCEPAIHPAWTSAICILPDSAKMDIFNYELTPNIMDLNIRGGLGVMFGPGVFNSMTDLRRVQVRNTKMVVFRSHAAEDVSFLTLYLDIEQCQFLLFERNSFHNLRGPMSVNITNCEAVTVLGETFSWLLDMAIANVRDLKLGSGSFSLDPTAANVGDHGPGMSVDLRNTTIKEIPQATFGSSAAKVSLIQVDIHAIRTGAFCANTYNVVLAINCSIHLIEEEAFSEKSLINYLNLDGCKIQQLATRAFRSAIADINIKRTRFDYVETGAINTTVATVAIVNSEFHVFMEKGFELSSWNNLRFENNSFDELPPNAIAAPAASIHKLVFNNNEIETMQPESLSFIGKAATRELEYTNNYYGVTCNCNMSHWLAQVLGVKVSRNYEAHSFCTVTNIIARCFNVHDQNMLVEKFLKEVCTTSTSIKCEPIESKVGNEIEIKNPRFPHKHKHDVLSTRNKKVIAIVIITCLGSLAVAILFSLYKWWRRGDTEGCASLKYIFIAMNTACTTVCRRLCRCNPNVDIDNVRSISEYSVPDYSERQRLNELRAQISPQETSFHHSLFTPTTETYTQTLPEELTKELLEHLKERLDIPENYEEARQTIEHLYELTKRTEEGPTVGFRSTLSSGEENIYDLPYENTPRLVGPNNKQVVSVGTKTPSLDKLMPSSPFRRQTALMSEYSEPQDQAVNLYAEIGNDKAMVGVFPDIITDQPAPKRPFQEMAAYASSSPSSSSSSATSPRTIGAVKALDSNSSTTIQRRPLPEKPQGDLRRADTGEGTSLKDG